LKLLIEDSTRYIDGRIFISVYKNNFKIAILTLSFYKQNYPLLILSLSAFICLSGLWDPLISSSINGLSRMQLPSGFRPLGRLR